ncbi:MAG: YetF domain-containing protein [Bacteroidota bacterium]
MKPEEIHLSDLQRILIGEIPAVFFLELILRALVIYLLLIGSMRLMGKRMSAQIGRNEMAAVVSLAAAVGIPLMNPDRGLLPPVLIAIVIVIFQVIIAKITTVSQAAEAISQDDLSTLVKDGVMNLKEMQSSRISRDRVFAQLRSLQQMNLGMVKRLYIEANGLFSLVTHQEPKTGLSLIPGWDEEFNAKMPVSQTFCACRTCGTLAEKHLQQTITRCPNCKDSYWVDAVE